MSLYLTTWIVTIVSLSIWFFFKSKWPKIGVLATTLSGILSVAACVEACIETKLVYAIFWFLMVVLAIVVLGTYSEEDDCGC